MHTRGYSLLVMHILGFRLRVAPLTDNLFAVHLPAEEVPKRKKYEQGQNHATIDEPLISGLTTVNNANQTIGDTNRTTKIQQLPLGILQDLVLSNQLVKRGLALGQNVVQHS